MAKQAQIVGVVKQMVRFGKDDNRLVKFRKSALASKDKVLIRCKGLPRITVVSFEDGVEASIKTAKGPKVIHAKTPYKAYLKAVHQFWMH